MSRAPRSKLPKGLSKGRRKHGSKARSNIPAIAWIRTLAAPYLRGYRATVETRGSLHGYRFISRSKIGRRKIGAKSSAGFFVGYLVKSENYEFLQPEAPECAVFAFIEPLNCPLYRRLVTPERSLLRQTAEYIGWLTHRPPRFAFLEDRTAVLVRHCSMREWPAGRQRHYSRIFFIETLAWLVRSGLVAKLVSQAIAAPTTLPSGKHRS